MESIITNIFKISIDKLTSLQLTKQEIIKKYNNFIIIMNIIDNITKLDIIKMYIYNNNICIIINNILYIYNIYKKNIDYIIQKKKCNIYKKQVSLEKLDNNKHLIVNDLNKNLSKAYNSKKILYYKYITNYNIFHKKNYSEKIYYYPGTFSLVMYKARIYKFNFKIFILKMYRSKNTKITINNKRNLYNILSYNIFIIY